MQDFAELVSIGLTIPTIALAAFVVILWGPAAKQAWQGGMKDSTSWFIVGVALGFLGAVLDNAYWQVAWCSHYINADVSDKLIENGVFFNIFSRQTLGIMAAFCHIKSYVMHDRNDKVLDWLNLICIASFAIGILNVISVIVYRHYP